MTSISKACLLISQNVKYYVLSITGILFLTLPLPTHALESSKSAVLGQTNSATPATSSPDVKVKLEALKKEIASRASMIKREVNDKLINKAWVGKVTYKSATQITISGMEDKQNIVLNEYTTYVTKAKSSTLKDILVDDNIIALGDVDDNNTLNAKKIIKQTGSLEYKKQIFWGQIESVKPIKLKTKDGRIYNLNMINKSLFLLGSKDGSIGDVKTGRKVIVSGTLSNNDLISVNLIYVLPSPLVSNPAKRPASSSAAAKKP